MMAGASWQRTHLQRTKGQGSRLYFSCASPGITSPYFQLKLFEREDKGWNNFESIYNLQICLIKKALNTAFRSRVLPPAHPECIQKAIYQGGKNGACLYSPLLLQQSFQFHLNGQTAMYYSHLPAATSLTGLQSHYESKWIRECSKEPVSLTFRIRCIKASNLRIRDF